MFDLENSWPLCHFWPFFTSFATWTFYFQICFEKKYVFYTSTKSADLLCIFSFVFKIRPNNKRSTDSKLTCYLMYVFPSCVVQNYVIHVYFSGCPFHLMASYCYEYFRCRKVTYSQSEFQINVENCINFKSG